MAIGFNMKCVADTGDYRVKPEQAWPTSRRDSHFAWLRCRFKIQLGAAGRAHPLVCFLRARLSISSDTECLEMHRLTVKPSRAQLMVVMPVLCS